MAVTENTYTGNGSTTNYSFTFPYLDTGDIKVTLNGTLTTAYTLANATTISFTSAPVNGATIRIYRDTDTTDLKATFFSGSAIRAQDLNSDLLQSLYATQESENEASSATATANTALTNSATAVSTANTAVSTANSAVSTANTASTNASAAVATANTASTNASTAVSTANTASANATTAINTANSATTTANNAVTTANGAVSTANTALTNANSAVSTANTASTNASAAVSTANTASSNATSAVNTANTATTTANSAVNTANSAVSTANSAVTTANAAAAAVANAVLYTTVANVAAIPGSPSNNDAVEVTDSTGIESFTPLSGLPGGFVGSSGLAVRLIYQSVGSTWTWIQYFPNDPEARYLKFSGGTLTGQLRGDDSASASTPGFAFDGDANTGMGRPGADELALITGGTARLTIDPAGAVSIPGTLGVTGAITGSLTGSASNNVLKAGDTMTGALGVTAGTAGAPSVFISGDTDTGLYSPGADQVAISTGGSGRLFVDASGNVGINTSNQQRRLHVVGSDGAVASFPTIGPRDIVLIENNNNCNFNLIAGTGAASEFKFTVDGASTHAGSISYDHTSNFLALRVNAAERLRITSAGLVGVGTSSVSANLHVQADTTPELLVQAGSSGSDSNRRATLSLLTSGSKLFKIQADASDGSLRILDSSTARLTIDSSGRCGIGTSSPGSNLDVRFGTNPATDNGGGTNTLRVWTSSALAADAGGAVSFGGVANVSGDPASWAQIAGRKENATGNAYGGYLQFAVNTGAGTMSERMRLDSSGRVGIGTTSPGDTLHVEGNIYLGTTARTVYQGGSANLILQTNTGNILFSRSNGSAESARIDSSGRLLVGTSSALTGGDTQYSKLVLQGNTAGTTGPAFLAIARGETAATTASANQTIGRIVFSDSAAGQYATIGCETDAAVGNNDYPSRLVFSTTADGASSPTERMRIANNGAISTVVPGGSTLYPAYDCRAWVNFNGTSTVSIRGNGNVSSITDNGTGDYTVNFTTAMPDANYSGVASASGSSIGSTGRFVCAPSIANPTTSAFRFTTGTYINAEDALFANVAIFR